MKYDMNELLEALAKYNCQVENKDGKIIITPTNDKQPTKPKFKRGDILMAKEEWLMCIFNEYENNDDCFKSFFNTSISDDRGWKTNYFRLATEEEKKELFELLFKQNKKWNAETCEIEELQPKFKHGDILTSLHDGMLCIFDSYYDDLTFTSLYNTSRFADVNWCTDCFRLATEDEKQKLFNKLAEEGKQWNTEKCEIETFKWKPKLHEDYYLPKFSERYGEFKVSFDLWDNVNIDNDRFTNWHIFKTKIECQKKCDELNYKIKKVK